MKTNERWVHAPTKTKLVRTFQYLHERVERRSWVVDSVAHLLHATRIDIKKQLERHAFRT